MYSKRDGGDGGGSIAAGVSGEGAEVWGKQQECLWGKLEEKPGSTSSAQLRGEVRAGTVTFPTCVAPHVSRSKDGAVEKRER